jgi:UDP-2-acetamido-3-amino-2,3-dideoxy-glucuronate N-acetyltransferase
MDSNTQKPEVFIHPQALVESSDVGDGTKVWAFAQIMRGAVVGGNCNIGGHAFIESGARLGSRVTLKNQVMVWNGVTIEDDVFVGPGVAFTNDLQPRSPRMEAVSGRYSRPENWLARTSVGRGASIGAGAVILPVRIGDHAMIAAGSIVTKDVPAHALMKGNPARVAGWVCVCGSKLDAGRECPSCGRQNDIPA